MGRGGSKLPPIPDRDLRILLSYNLDEGHFKQLYRKFTEIDVALNGVWTANEVYKVINEPRMSIRAPILDRIFFMGDGKGEGAMIFQDFLVAFTSFCALSKEEVVQFLFMVIDDDRNGTCEKSELLEFFSYLPPGCNDRAAPLFPVNNKNALDKFRGGLWDSLEFDGVAQLCERFPYIPYPAYHVQDQFRKVLLGKDFWQRLDQDRMVQHGMPRKRRRVQLPGSREKVEVKPPPRTTMPEFLEYSRRKTRIANGKRVEAEGSATVPSNMAMERDEQIARAPLSNMIRNPRCMYHVPYKPAQVAKGKSTGEQGKPEFEVDDSLAMGIPSGVIMNDPDAVMPGALPIADDQEDDESESDLSDSDEDN